MINLFVIIFFFNDTATTEIYTLSLHDALPTSHDGQVRAAQRAVLELRRKVPVAHVVARDGDQAGRAFVEPMHDPRPHRASGHRPAPAASEQRVDQRSGVVAGRGVHDHPGRLVDDGEILVFIKDIERDVLRGGVADVGLRDLELDHVARGYVVGGIGSVTVDVHEVALDESRRGGAAEVLSVLGEKAIQPQGGRRRDQAAWGLRITYPRISKATPMLTAESATLKTGQKWKLMKSVTPPPLMTLSKALPTAPPRINPSTASADRSPGWRTT